MTTLIELEDKRAELQTAIKKLLDDFVLSIRDNDGVNIHIDVNIGGHDISNVSGHREFISTVEVQVTIRE